MEIFLVSEKIFYSSFASGSLIKLQSVPIISFVESYLADNFIEENNLNKFKSIISQNKKMSLHSVLPPISSLTREDIIFLKNINISCRDKEYLSSKDFDNLSDENIEKYLNRFKICFYEISKLKLVSILE